MNNILFIILPVILFVGTMGFFAWMEKKRNIAEIERLREVVRAIKTKDIQEYENVLPPLKDIELPEKDEDELVPLEEVDPEQLLKHE